MSRMSIKRRNIEKTKIKGQKAPKRRNEHKWFNVLIFLKKVIFYHCMCNQCYYDNDEREKEMRWDER